MIRWLLLKYGVLLVCVVGSGAMLVHVSNHVQYVERDVRKLGRAIDRERESLRILQAEWAYLNNPSRLEDLARNYAGLVAPSSGQVVSRNPFVDSRNEPLESEVQINDSKSSSRSVLMQNISYTQNPSQSAVSAAHSSMIEKTRVKRYNDAYVPPAREVRR